MHFANGTYTALERTRFTQALQQRRNLATLLETAPGMEVVPVPRLGARRLVFACVRRG